MELQRKKVERMHLGGREGRRHRHTPGRERVPPGGKGWRKAWVFERDRQCYAELFVSRVFIFYLEVSGKDLNRIFISFLGVSFQSHGLC